jgi:hypothetical protein
MQISYFVVYILTAMRIFIICLMLLLSSTIVAQTDAEVINNIRKEFKTINNTKDFEIITLENEDFLANATDGGAKLAGYYKK